MWGGGSAKKARISFFNLFTQTLGAMCDHSASNSMMRRRNAVKLWHHIIFLAAANIQLQILMRCVAGGTHCICEVESSPVTEQDTDEGIQHRHSTR